jgi:cell cycle arrest protein BUB3
MSESRTEFKLKNPPDDGISSVQFGPNAAKFLLVSSWDCTVRLYDVESTTMRLKYTHSMPVLDVCFQVRLFSFLFMNRRKLTGVSLFLRMLSILLAVA